MEVAVQPHRRTVPWRRGATSARPAFDGRSVDHVIELSEAARWYQGLGRVFNGTPRNGLSGASGGCSTVQGGEEPAEHRGGRDGIDDGSVRGRAGPAPRAHAPRPRVAPSPGGRHHRRRDGQRQSGASTGSHRCSSATSPAAISRRGSRTTSSAPSRKMKLSQPASSSIRSRAARLGTLVPQEGPHEVLVDRDLGGGLVGGRHRSRMPPRSGSRQRGRRFVAATTGTHVESASRAPRGGGRSQGACDDVAAGSALRGRTTGNGSRHRPRTRCRRSWTSTR